MKPQRSFPNPPPLTLSAREALSSFHCTLCSKGYSRQPDYEAHLSSYDHSHRARLRDMKALTRDPQAADKARRAEEKANKGSGIISIKLGGETEGKKKGGFKKGGFKSAFAPVEGASVEKKEDKKTVGEESDTEDEGYEHYDPTYPTD